MVSPNNSTDPSWYIGQEHTVPIHSSNCLITNLKIDKNRKALLERKKKVEKQKNKHKEGMSGMD
jgi:hypothetical protein